MGFKTDTSFLRYLTMGAVGVRQTMRWLQNNGFQPIELERYCGSNKIWMTKVKRLRLPDVLCVRTGLRLEIRAKSDLKIKMSDAPKNPDRTWDAGLRDDDVIALIAVCNVAGSPEAADEPVFFTVDALRRSVGTSKLGKPKSASEGAEQDRTWPAVVPSRSGAVRTVNADKFVVEFGGDGAPARSQTYTLNGKRAYVAPGDKFKAKETILAGTPASLADLDVYKAQKYEPLTEINSQNPLSRYAAVKALVHREDLHKPAVPALEKLLTAEKEERVALEAAGSAAALGSRLGQEMIEALLRGNGRTDLKMEAVLILSEIASPVSRKELVRVASDKKFRDDEIRQAAVWGLGKAGLKSYADLIPFLDDENENVAMHAIVGFDEGTPMEVITTLIDELMRGDKRIAPAVSRALRQIGTPEIVAQLCARAGDGNNWMIATLGSLPISLVDGATKGTPLAARVAPLLLLNETNNWLQTEDRVMDLAFLDKQKF